MKKSLNIGVISRVASPTVNRELAREARLRGHRYTQVVFDQADLTQVDLTFDKAELYKYDILYYRTSLGFVWALALQKYLDRHSLRAIGLTVQEFPFLNSKAQQAISVASAGVLTPKTIFDKTGEYDSIESQLGSVFVAKACKSSQGKDVHLIQSKEQFARFFTDCAKKEYIYQEYIPHDYDCRIHLVDGKAVCGYRRVQTSNDFRCNVSLGASMEPLEERDQANLFPLANKISKLFNLELHVVDFLLNKKDGKYYFVEINDNAGWEQSDTDATGVDMSALVIDSFEKKAAQNGSSDSLLPVSLVGVVNVNQ
jgi:biotin carboxylase